MDRYDEKAREMVDTVARKHGGMTTPATCALTAAILRAAAEMGKAGETGKPRELTIDSRSGAVWRPGEPLHSVQCWEGAHRRCPTTMRAPDGSLVACACACHAEPARPTAPQPTATVEEVIDALRLEATLIPTFRLRRALSALSPEQRAVMVAAIGGEK